MRALGHGSASDERILDLLAEASPAAIEMLYDRYGRLAFSLAHRVLGDMAAAEDVVQEAFLSVWRRSSTYRTDRGSLLATGPAVLDVSVPQAWR